MDDDRKAILCIQLCREGCVFEQFGWPFYCLFVGERVLNPFIVCIRLLCIGGLLFRLQRSRGHQRRGHLVTKNWYEFCGHPLVLDPYHTLACRFPSVATSFRATPFRVVSRGSELSASDEDSTWISWFVSLRGNEFFCEVRVSTRVLILDLVL